jgi:hypothetical protein
MLIQTNNDIIEFLNDDILFIVKTNNNQDNEDWSSVYLIKRDGVKIYGKMTKHSLELYSKFIINQEKWNLLKSNMSFYKYL